MTNRAETIMQTVADLLTGLATTGANVERSRAWPISELPALTIMQGNNQVATDDDAELGTVMRQLEIKITSTIKATSLLETQLNSITAQIFAVLAADKSLGLAYVFDTQLESDAEPEIEAEQDEPTARQLMTWAVLYEHSDTSTEA